MSTFVIDEARSTQYTLNGSNDLLTITRNGNIGVYGDTSIGLLEAAGSSNNTIRVFGQVYAAPGTGAGRSIAIQISGTNTHLIIGSSAFVTGERALEVYGANATVENHGDLIGQGYSTSGLTFTSGTFSNSGRISADYGVSLYSGTFVNEAGGEVFGASFAMVTTGTGTTNVVNHGSIRGFGGSAIQAYYGNDKFTNDGVIQGSIYLNDGDDLVDNRGGRIIGPIYGAEGSDTLITDKASDVLLENTFSAGTDSVKSTVSYTLSANVERLLLLGAGNINATGTANADKLFGNAGNNLIRGLQGADTLAGKTGNDALIGGADGDHFAFRKGDGIDTIRDFEDAIDTIYISGFAAIDSFAQLKPFFEKHGDDIWIDFGQGGRLVLLDTTRAELGSADFPFPL